jgi:hypothetical protein
MGGEMMGGEGVGRVGRYLWYTLSSKKVKFNSKGTKWNN